jgi:hypothetical protein
VSRGIGVGVGVGLGGVGLSPAWLSAQAQAIFTGVVAGDYAPEDMVMSGADVSSRPGRVGGTLTNAVAGRFAASTLNGRAALLGVQGVVARLSGTVSLGSVKTVLAVLKMPVYAPARYIIAADVPADAGTIQNYTGSTTLYTAGGWTHGVNGVASETLPAEGTVALIRATNASGASMAINIASTAVASCWDAPAGRYLFLTSTITEAQELAWLAAVRRYYRF